MTPTEIETLARQRYNSVGDTFWSQAEIFSYLDMATQEACRFAGLIERTYSTTTVAGTQEYAFPTTAVEIKRVTWSGVKLKPISMREDDYATGYNMATTSQGSPAYYFIWNKTISLRPIPASAATLKLWTRNQPSAISSTSTLEVPTEFHHDLVHCLNREMALKDQNYDAAKNFSDLWEKSLVEMRKYMRKQKRTDDFAQVQTEEMIGDGSLSGI